jgi:hypothetical protein
LFFNGNKGHVLLILRVDESRRSSGLPRVG